MAVLSWLFGDDANVLRRRNFQALLLANVIGPLGTALISPILDSLIEPFGATPATIGLVISFFTAPPIVMIPLVGVLADRYGRKPILVTAILGYGLAGTLIVFTTDFQIVLGLRFVQGIAYAGLTPIIITSIGDIYEGSLEATAQGLRFTGSGLTQAAVPLLSGALVTIAWYYPFLFYALAFPIAVVCYAWFDEPEGGDESAPRDEVAADGSEPDTLRSVLRQPYVLALVVARGLPVVIWIGFLTYNSIIVVRLFDGTPTQAGILVTIASVSYALAASQAGRIADTFDSRFLPLVGANVCLGVGFATFLLAPTIFVAAVGIVVTGVGFGVTLSLYRSLITGITTKSLRGGLVGVSESIGRFAATVTPLYFGWVITVTSPRIGIGPSLQLAGVASALLVSTSSILCLVVFYSASSYVD
ncbi:MFS transporter [Halorubellus sp. JP-L1]|uniref:MFS transporter n=1 Tax=Halorubellus sp. JP-L1 TaxID=2715753 RepID=UPI00140E6E17|nr:MFS transporter [Halorubellus sp. JP-L1]